MRKNKRNSAFFPRENEKKKSLVIQDRFRLALHQSWENCHLARFSRYSTIGWDLFKVAISYFYRDPSLHTCTFMQNWSDILNKQKEYEKEPVSSIKPQFDNQIFVDLWFLYKLWTWNCFCFAELAEQFQVHNLYKTRKSTKHRLSNWGLIEEITDLSRILLALT